MVDCVRQFEYPKVIFESPEEIDTFRDFLEQVMETELVKNNIKFSKLITDIDDAICIFKYEDER